jgi:hypothetical protein
VWFVDFEYSREDNREPPAVVCMTAKGPDGAERRMFREELLARKGAPFPTGEHACIVAYSAGAEGACFAALGWSDPVNVIDPYAEHLLDLNGRPDAYEIGSGLLDAMRHHRLPVRPHAHKEAMRDKARFQKVWPEEDRPPMLDYCMEDNDDAEAVLQAQTASGLNWSQALWRGRYMWLVGSHIEHNGLPIDTDTYRELWESLPHIRAPLLTTVDRYGLLEDGHVRDKRFNAMVERIGLADIWPRTAESGKYKRDEATWKEMAGLRPSLKPLRDAFMLLDQLEQPEFAIGHDDRNRFWWKPLLTKTGRCAASPKENLLGAPKWWRGAVTPPGPDVAVVEIDYSSQENWIAAGRSGCPTMLREVSSGDIHLTTAISMRLAPEGATAESHPAERNKAKPLTHGANYGISHVGVSKRLGITQREARHLLRTYDEAHPVFRDWQQMVVRRAYSTRRIAVPMGWAMHVTAEVSRRTLLNWGMQSTGGEILRAAVVLLVRHGFTIVATAHDSIYFLMPLAGLEERVALARALMSSVTLSFTNGLPIPTKAKVVRPGERLLDGETRPVWDRLLALARGQIRVPETVGTFPPVGRYLPAGGNPSPLIRESYEVT